MKKAIVYFLLLTCLGLNAQNKPNGSMPPPPPPPPPFLPDAYPEFPGGNKAFDDFISSNLKYPAVLKQKKDVGVCRTKFTVEADGSIKNISIVKPTNGCPECDAEAKRLVSVMPKWKPALKNGKAIAFEHGISFDFSLEKKQPLKGSENEIFTVTEIMPQFPGGEAEANKFIQKNLVIPASAKKNNISEKCYVKFVVTKDGSIKDITIIKGIPNCPECNEEAKKVIAKMPKWTPGKQNGLPVAVYYTKSINFTLK